MKIRGQALSIGAQVQTAGFVTTQIYLQGRTLVEIEQLLGFHKGRLSLGAYILVALELPQAGGFELAGYSQVAGHHTLEQYGDINNPGDFSLIHFNSSHIWGLSGKNRLVKVVPIIGHFDQMKDDDQYPPGSGVPQWKITKPINFIVEAAVSPYRSGRYIPEQGYKEIRYR